MRNVIAALVALAAVGFAGWLGWNLLDERVAPPEEPASVEQVLADFADTFNAGDRAALRSMVHEDDRPGLDALLAATDDMRTSLAATDVTLEVGEVAVEGQRASAPTTVTVVVAPRAPSPAPSPASDASPASPDATPNATPDATPSATPGATSDATPGATSDATSGATPTTTPSEEVDEPVTMTWDGRLTAVQRRSGWVPTPSLETLHPRLREGGGFTRTVVETDRASLLDVNGEALTTHGDLVSLGIEPGRVNDPEVLADTWERVLPQTLPDLLAVLERDDLNPTWFYPVAALPPDVVERAWAQLRTQPGVLRRDADDVTPTGSTFAHHVLGRVGEPTAEQVEQGMTPGEPAGLYGLERVLEDRLVGSDRTEVALVDEDGDVVEVLATAQSDESGPVSTSLDEQVQQAIENALIGIDDPVAVVAVRTDGGIAGAASRPVNGYNRAFEGRYPPGDALLPVATTALVADGRRLDTTAECPERDAVVGAAAEAPDPRGETDLATALAAGCDTTLAAAVADLDPGVLLDTGRAFGFGADFDLPVPAASGELPEPVDATEAVRTGLGQARVLASPLLVATQAATTLAGEAVTPWLLVEQRVAPSPLEVDTAPAHDVMVAAATGGSGIGLVTAEDAGAIAGTAPVTGSSEEHAWVVTTVADHGFAVLVEDTDGDLEVARAIMQRIDRELATLLAEDDETAGDETPAAGQATPGPPTPGEDSTGPAGGETSPAATPTGEDDQ